VKKESGAGDGGVGGGGGCVFAKVRTKSENAVVEEEIGSRREYRE